MVNKLKAMAVVVALLMTAQNTVFAATVAGTAGPFPVSASVSSTTTFRASIYRNLPNNAGPDFAGGTRSSMAFGMLEEQTFTRAGQPTFKELRSSDATGVAGFAVVFEVNTHQQRYEIQQSGTALTSGGNTIPPGACTVTPVYSPADNGNATMPAGASLGAPGPWTVNNKLIYASGTTGASRVIQAVYGVSGLDQAAGGTQAVPIDQPTGNYSGTVTFTLVLI